MTPAETLRRRVWEVNHSLEPNMRVHRVRSTGIPLPPTIKPDQGRKLPGGLPPVAGRNSWARAGETGRSARVFGERRTRPDQGW